MTSQLRPALVTIAFFSLLLGLAYPLALWGLAGIALPHQATGSLIRRADGRIVGSSLIGQAFGRPEYLHPRPSAAGAGYDPTQSGGSNYGPLDPKLASRIRDSAKALGGELGATAIPVDAVTASASGLDPEISPAYAHLQTARIARARGLTRARVDALIDRLTAPRTLGVLGEPRVNVLEVNLALDRGEAR